jgi:hypothetical protein
MPQRDPAPSLYPTPVAGIFPTACALQKEPLFLSPKEAGFGGAGCAQTRVLLLLEGGEE